MHFFEENNELRIRLDIYASRYHTAALTCIAVNVEVLV